MKLTKNDIKQKRAELVEVLLKIEKLKNDKTSIEKTLDAYFKRRGWHKTGLPESSFFHALKKVKDFFEVDKHWAGLTNRRRSRGGRLE